jgi:hypothetical protein
MFIVIELIVKYNSKNWLDFLKKNLKGSKLLGRQLQLGCLLGAELQHFSN